MIQCRARLNLIGRRPFPSAFPPSMIFAIPFPRKSIHLSPLPRWPLPIEILPEGLPMHQSSPIASPSIPAVLHCIVSVKNVLWEWQNPKVKQEQCSEDSGQGNQEINRTNPKGNTVLKNLIHVTTCRFSAPTLQ